MITFVNQSWTACAYVKANLWSNQIAKEAIKKKRHLWVIKIYQECSSLELWRQYQWSTKTIVPLLFIQLCKHNRQNIKKKFFLCNCNYLVSCWYLWLLDHEFAVFVSSFKSWSKSSSRPLTEKKTRNRCCHCFPFYILSSFFVVGLYFNLLTKDALVLGSEIKKSGGKKFFLQTCKNPNKTCLIYFGHQQSGLQVNQPALNPCIYKLVFKKTTVGGLIIYIGILWLLSGK